MKKLLILALVALVASSAFAEITLKGDVDFGFGSDFAKPEDVGTDGKTGYAFDVDDLDLDFTGTVDDFNTVTFGLSWDDEVFGQGLGQVASFTLKSDITGAFGIDAPVDVTLISGYNDYFGSQAYDSATRYALDDIADRGMDKRLLIGFDAVIVDLVTLSFGLNPALASSDDSLAATATDGTDTDAILYEDKGNYLGLPAAMFIGLYGTFGMVDAEIYYNMGNSITATAGGLDWTGFARDSIGASAAATIPVGDLEVGVSVSLNYDLLGKYTIASVVDEATGGAANFLAAGDEVELANTFDLGFGAKVTWGALDAGISSALIGAREVKLNGTTVLDVDSMFGLGFDLGYMLTDWVTVYGGVSISDLGADDIYFTAKSAADDGAAANAGMEFGADFAVGSVNYIVGYQVGAGSIENLIDSEGAFMRIKAEF